MKRQIATVLATTILLTACGSPNSAGSSTTEDSGDGKLVVWGFYEGPAKKALDDYAARTGVEVEYQTIGWGDYQTKLNTVLGTADAPDLMMLERSFIGTYSPTNNIVNLEELYGDTPELKAYIENTAIPTKGPGLVDDKVKAIGWENSAGAFFYRSDIAEKAFGITTVEEMEAMIQTEDDFWAMQDTMRNSADPEISGVTLLSYPDFRDAYLQKSGAYTVNGDEYVVTKEFGDALDKIKWVIDNKMVYAPDRDKTQIMAGVAENKILGSLSPAWGVQVVKEYEEPGLWSIAKSPFNWTAGGTLLAMSTSADKDLAWDYLQHSFLDEQWLVDNMTEFGMVGNEVVMEKYLSNNAAGDEYFSGQNTVAKLSEINSAIDSYVPVSPYDSGVSTAIQETMEGYAINGTIATVDEAKTVLKDKLAVLYPSLNVTIE